MTSGYQLGFLPTVPQSAHGSGRATTPLSGSRRHLCRLRNAVPRAVSLARSSLCLLAIAMATPACLVTSTPSFDPPKRTAPFLITSSAEPNARNVIIFDEKMIQSMVFTADVISEDNGQDVLFLLYVDFGFTPPEGQPPDTYPLFRGLVPNIKSLDPGTMADPKPRRMMPGAKWVPQVSGAINPGCHTVTMMASHAFDTETQCPKCLNDSSQITWQVYYCNSAKGDDCTPDFSNCQGWNRSCLAVPNPDDKDECGGSP
jgi:hypothetical protein